jgi:YfiR/HmsC-like
MILYPSKSVFADSVEEYTAKSILTLNLARFSEWPPEVFKANTSTVNLCLIGNEADFQPFNMIDKKQVGNKSLLLHNISNIKQLDDCHLLYVSADTRINAGLIEDSYKRHILTIGETEDFLGNGGAVYLEVIDSKITLHVNLAATQKAGVQISSRVLKLATIYNP